MHSKDIAVGYALGYNDGLGQGGASNGGDFRAIFDDNSGILTIVVQDGEKYADYQFGYEVFDFSDEITTQTVVGEETVKTTRNFTKRIVTSLFDDSGVVLLATNYNADSGVILGYTDGSGEVVHTAEWRSEYESVVSQSPGAASAAVAWVIARNTEQTTSLSEEKQAYKDGLKVGVEGGADITEEYEQDGNSFTLTTNDNGGITEPFIANLTNGIYCVTNDGRYVHIWLDMSYQTVKEFTSVTGTPMIDTRTGAVMYDAYNSDGTLIASEQTGTALPWSTSVVAANTGEKYQSSNVVSFALNVNDVTTVRKITDQSGQSRYDTQSNFVPNNSQVRQILFEAVVITNMPPNTIT